MIEIVYLQNFLLCDEDIGGKKSAKAKELGFVFHQSVLKSPFLYLLTFIL